MIHNLPCLSVILFFWPSVALTNCVLCISLTYCGLLELMTYFLSYWFTDCSSLWKIYFVIPFSVTKNRVFVIYITKVRHLNKLKTMIYNSITECKHNSVRSTRSRSHPSFCFQYSQALVSANFTSLPSSQASQQKRAKNAWKWNTAIIDFMYMFTELLTSEVNETMSTCQRVHPEID
jgi:hypothetical protein